MDFRRPNHDDHGNQEMSSDRPPIHESTFSKPALPSPSSLLSAGDAGDPSPASVSYRECLRNHAASLGSHVLDGCGEFMPGATDSLKCAACGCHRSFHRRESQSYHLFDRRPPNNSCGRIPLLLSPPALQKQIQSLGGMESSSEELGLATPPPKKRFRTKFTEEQKEKMMELAERIGWKIQRQDDANLERFFAEIGISRQVFKVWMHNNNKNSVRKQHQ
ncbi:zinc-finger homeodomain protein 1-like [Dendrobium catenatum]|uniref:ZF-HD homeobox protein n=1 Tax=Dendrobium catenatum TaxID=906689 RepID=A0A2I0XGB2_9ASPA|nr:zinc-finger homeodomain protein 1-like [Dendrobium catenatum]PKU86948.1 ZF-HD homeobox protein [Dendrobium catenatum]